MEEPVEDRTRAKLLGRRPVRLAHLPQDLALPHHHRVERTRYPVQMPHGLVVRQPVRVPRQTVFPDPFLDGQSLKEHLLHTLILDHRAELRAVASGEEDRLSDRALFLETPQKRAGRARREGHPLPHFYGCRAVAHPRNRDKHSSTTSSSSSSALRPSRRALPNSSTMPAHSKEKASSSSRRILCARVGDAPPVETATCSCPRLKVEGKAKSPSEGSSATFTGMLLSTASRATAAFTSRRSVAANARNAPSRSPSSYGLRRTSAAMLASSGFTSGEITTTSALACRSLLAFRFATSPPPTTTQRLPSRSRNMGKRTASSIFSPKTRTDRAGSLA